ncbi:ATP-dependent DNA helicase DDX11 isoform X2 [Zea mays]|uniref:Helicase ATP-binding domain-containing protein n=1 Tax=Zea mays TaxID=4577 RepID=A0A804PYU8_MAIZE|nr:ATP-dependent DNA helicase DDX11 isoform X2 [Zea mays]|eukprot:XP_008649467.1 ATP-dependent DNA helicase DDX11 isoform X2 [Zea mays]
MPMPPPPRKDFPAFPFAPYPIQSEFMSFLYAALSSGPGALALLESPTGTGKTLSIICSALQWLLDHREAAVVAATALAHPSGASGSGGDDDEPDWLRDFKPAAAVKESTKKKAKPPAMRKTLVSRKPDGFGEEDGGDDEGEFLLEEYESDSEDVARRGVGKRAHCGSSSSSSSEDDDEMTPKVFFTSRTHSQLSQFVGELKRTEFAGRIRTVCLGSRKNLCINKDVLKMGSGNRINERCLELQKNKKSTKIKLKAVLSCLDEYLDRFYNVLGAGNRRYIQTLTVLTKSFIRVLINNQDGASTMSSMTINQFLFSLDIDNINIVKLCQFVKESNIIHKVCGYANKLSSIQNQFDLQLHDEGSSIACFQALVDFLRSLLNSNDDGRIIVAKQKLGGQPDEAYLKFVMLCAEKIFSEVTQDAYAVILAGGTLQPIEETRLRLCPSLPPTDIKFFTCNHIVPPESILPIAVTRGPSGKAFDFSYNSRSSPSMIEELGRFICNIITVVPEGVVMFFSSYDYERRVYDAWMTTGTISRISKKKHVFREPRNSADVEAVLNKYKEAIESCSNFSQDTGVNGALLLAVVGGKISEGINFSNGMGRCVIMVGLPYPSPSDVELIETIKHIESISSSFSVGDDKALSRKYDDECELQPGYDILRKCTRGGREYYENLCMKAVNQSIGRAIRHINDYAAMLLVDSRYAQTSSTKSFSCPADKLPQWIKARLSCAQNYGEVHRSLHQFFKFNKKNVEIL